MSSNTKEYALNETTRPATGGFARSAIAAVLAATAAAVVIWAVAVSTGADLTVISGGRTTKITVVNVIVAALVGSLAGWGVLALLRRFTTNARAIWTVIAIVALMLSLGGPLVATAAGSTKAWLVAMHLAVATVLILGLRRTPGR